jgi:UDPglucose 6-dehydrogenase
MKLCVAGTGYVGLVTGACFADLGNQVICVDIDAKKVARLKKGLLPIYEPGLEEVVKRNIKEKRLTFTTKLVEGVRSAEMVFIAVGTPSAPNGEANLEFVKEVARGIGRTANGDKIVVDKSTVPVGMGDLVESLVEEEFEKRGVKHKVQVVSCPEFLREGSALYDFQNPDRIVVGSKNEAAARRVAELFKPLNARVLITDVRSAEMIKYASNSFLAVKISFINEIANLCELVGADVARVAEGMGQDKRIGAAFLNAGAGYGGSCFPKDVLALIRIAEKEGYDFQILKSVVTVNDRQKKSVLARLKRLVGPLEGKRVGLLGLAFKANTDDMRDAVSLDVVEGLRHLGARVQAYDPAAMDEAAKRLPGLKLCHNAYEAARGADCVVVLTEWNEFKELDLERLKKSMKHPVLLDARNIYEGKKLRAMGFTYQGIGRP